MYSNGCPSQVLTGVPYLTYPAPVHVLTDILLFTGLHVGKVSVYVGEHGHQAWPSKVVVGVAYLREGFKVKR